MMRELTVRLIIGTLVFAWSSVSYGNESSQIAEALRHVEAAISTGQMGHADVQAERAQTALMHLEMAKKAKSDPNVIEATKALKKAIEQGKMGHADIETKALEGAVIHLKMAYKEWDRPGGCPEGPPCKNEDGKERKK